MKNLQLKVLCCCCGTISCCTTAGLTINVALVGVNKFLYPVADVSALTVNTPGLESLLIFPKINMFAGQKGVVVHDIKYEKIQNGQQQTIIAFVHHTAISEDTGEVKQDDIPKVMVEKK